MAIHTTLYDLSAALSAEVGPDEADVVTAAVMHLLNTHRITASPYREILHETLLRGKATAVPALKAALLAV